MFVSPSIGEGLRAQLCAVCLLLPLTYTIRGGGRGIQDRPCQATLSPLFTFGCALYLLYTMSAALAVLSARNVIFFLFLLHVMRSAASCFLHPPFVLFYLFFFFASAAYWSHETPLRQRESWRSTRRLLSHDQFFKIFLNKKEGGETAELFPPISPTAWLSALSTQDHTVRSDKPRSVSGESARFIRRDLGGRTFRRSDPANVELTP